jgi:hypothetical protein
MNVPPVYPETGRHEGALLILHVFGSTLSINAAAGGDSDARMGAPARRPDGVLAGLSHGASASVALRTGLETGRLHAEVPLS